MDRLDTSLSENIRILSQVIQETYQGNTRRDACSYPLTGNQLRILRMLAFTGDMQNCEIAKSMQISTAAVSKNIDRLEEWGLVSRRPCPEDRRCFAVILNDQGRTVVSAYDALLTRKQQSLMDQFTREEKLVLLDFVRRVIRFTLAAELDAETTCPRCGGRGTNDCLVCNSKEALDMPPVT